MAATESLADQIHRQLPSTSIKSAVYEPARGEIRLYRRRLTGDALSDPSRRPQAYRVVRVQGWPSFEQVREVLRANCQGVHVWDGSLPDVVAATHCRICQELYGHHDLCPVRLQPGDYPRGMAEFWAGYHRGHAGEATITERDVRSAYSLGVLRGLEDRRRSSS